MDDKKNADTSQQMRISKQLQIISHFYRQIKLFLFFTSNSFAVG